MTYKNDAKTRLLGIDPELIRQKSAVSYEVAQAMAEGVHAPRRGYRHRRDGHCRPAWRQAA